MLSTIHVMWTIRIKKVIEKRNSVFPKKKKKELYLLYAVKSVKYKR